ncbi:MAG: ATP-binding cassette domain-containing protein [Dialister invisus]
MGSRPFRPSEPLRHVSFIENQIRKTRKKNGNARHRRLKKRCYRDLSGGQQQRVLFARALCATGKLLLLTSR